MKSNENQQAKAKAGNQREAENKAGNRKRHKTNPPADTGKADSCRGIFTQQITGVEPAFPAWEASVLPMNHICTKNGAYGIRTHDLLNAIQTRSQLR